MEQETTKLINTIATCRATIRLKMDCFEEVSRGEMEVMALEEEAAARTVMVVDTVRALLRDKRETVVIKMVMAMAMAVTGATVAAMVVATETVMATEAVMATAAVLTETSLMGLAATKLKKEETQKLQERSETQRRISLLLAWFPGRPRLATPDSAILMLMRRKNLRATVNLTHRATDTKTLLTALI
jgi:hypothetical protein